MPFITEELWQSLKMTPFRFAGNDTAMMPPSIMIAPYPIAEDKAFAPEAERVMDSVIEIVRSIRNVRAQYKVKPSLWIAARVYTGGLLSKLSAEANMIETLAKARPVTILGRQKRESTRDKELVLVLKEAEVVVPLAGIVDRLTEEQRLMKESAEIRGRIAQLEARLRGKAFLEKAPAQVVEKEKQKLAMLEDKLRRLHQELSQLNSSWADS
jgi:valyl-tRNA synthetase